MRWLAIKRTDDAVDPYAVAYCTHTVSKALVYGVAKYHAWRLAKPMPVPLGVFDEPDGAKLACEQDARRKQASAA